MDDRYRSGLKGLNISGGKNRFKFQSKQARARRVDVDVAHKVRAEGFLDSDKAQDPDVEGGSFFQQELDRCKELNVTPPFKRFYYKVWPLAQSLAELVHHAPTVVDMLLALLEDPTVAAQAGGETLQLISVLGRDLQSSFFPHFPRVSAVLVALVTDPDVAPENCGRVFRCLGFLLKFVARPLSKDISAARTLYAPLLGHRRDFARKMAAQTLAPAVRRLKPKVMRRHAKQLVGALAAGSVAAGAGESPGGARLRADTLDGCSQLLFFVAKGVHGRMHSQAPVLLRALMDSVLPPDVIASISGGAGKSDFKGRKDELERAWCFELVSAVLGLLVDHVRSPHSAELWFELHYGVGVATARYRASMAAPGDVSGDCDEDDEGPECAGVRRTIDLLSQAVGHMRGILLREQAIGAQQAALLAELFSELTSPGLFWHRRTSSTCRTAIVELLSVSLCGLYEHQRLLKDMPHIIQAVVTPLSSDDQPHLTSIAWVAQDFHPALVLLRSLFGEVGVGRAPKAPPIRVTREVVVGPMLEACGGQLSQQEGIVLEILVRVIHGTGAGLASVDAGDDRSNRGVRATLENCGADEKDGKDEGDDRGAFIEAAGVTCVGDLSVGMSTGEKLLDICADCVERSIPVLEGLDVGAPAARAEHPLVLSRAVAALRCLPVLVGSSMKTERARSKAVVRSLSIIERLLILCSVPDGNAGGTASVHRDKADAASGHGPVAEHGQKSSRAIKRKKPDGDQAGANGDIRSRRAIVGVGKGGGACSTRGDIVVLRAYALEAGLGLCCLMPLPDDRGVESERELERLMCWYYRAVEWLQARPASIATLRAVALLLLSIRAASRPLGDSLSFLTEDASLSIMNLLEPNLASESRLLRLSTLRVLAQYDALKRARDTSVRGSDTTAMDSSDTALNFLQIAEALEALPISIACERDLMWRLGQLEVLGGSVRLPRRHARLMATHALGLLRVKFSAVWPKAAAILAALCQRSVEHREVVWQALHEALRKVMPPPAIRKKKAASLGAPSPPHGTGPRGGQQFPGGGGERGDSKADSVGGSASSSTGRGNDGDSQSADLETGPHQSVPSLAESSGQLRKAVAPQQWVPRLLSDAAALDAGPTAEMDLPVVLEGVFMDITVRTGLRPKSGEVPLWASTDADSAFAQVWGVLSQCPELLQQRSRTVVPLFLGFMQYQFLGEDAFPDDPEVRAVEIERHLTPTELSSEGPRGWRPVVRSEATDAVSAISGVAEEEGGGGAAAAEVTGRTADRRSVRGRLVALLDVFAAATSPKSLYKQRVLYRVYRALLAMPDDKIAGLALRCMLSFKSPFLVPYKASLEGLMSEESFRDKLVTFSLRSEGSGAGDNGGDGKDRVSLPSSAPRLDSTTIDDSPAIDPLHRSGLIPVVIRIVYGRLSAAAGSSRSRAGGAHGGPAARRAAVLAFLSGLRSEELTELFALMIRPFLPSADSSSVLGSPASAAAGAGTGRDVLEEGLAEWDDVAGEATRAREVLQKSVNITPDCLGLVPVSRQAGFLKLVKEVARQLGQRALPYVDMLLRLVLALLEHSNAVSGTEKHARCGDSNAAQTVGGAAEEDNDAEDEDNLLIPAASTIVPAASSALSSSPKGKTTTGALRALCLRALSEFLAQFANSFDFAAHQDALWPALAGPIQRLPASTIGATKPTALLTLAETLSESEALLPMLSITSSDKGGGALVPAVVECISAGASGGRIASPAVVGSVLSIVERLLRYDNGRLLAPHLNRLISSFGARLTVTGTSGKKGTVGAGGRLDSHGERGLAILARVAEMTTSEPLSAAADADTAAVLSGAIDASSMSELLALLVPSLHPDRRASDDAKSSILRTISALARRVDSPGARRAWPALSRLLGPAGARPSGMAVVGPRRELVRALEALSSRPDLAASAGSATTILTELNARDSVALDEPDFRRVVPAYNSLSEGTCWADVIASGGTECWGKGSDGSASLGGMLAAAPVAYHCFHAMYDQELAVRGAAAAALKRLAREAAVIARERPAEDAQEARCPWEGLMRTVVMPGLRAGMACRTEVVRKGYISLLREALSAYQTGDQDSEDSKANVKSASVIPSDLWILAREDEPESDFFLNACHIQIHRRARALAKARKVIEDSEAAAAAGTAEMTIAAAPAAETGTQRPQPNPTKDERHLPPACPFRVSTLVHFLLPLALHPLHELTKGNEAGLVGQAIQLTSAISRHLPWTHYNSALRGLMQQVAPSRGSAGESDSPEKERAMVSAMCGVLDGFHFPIIPPATESPTTPQITSVADMPSASMEDDDDAQDKGKVTAAVAGDAVWRAVNSRLLPSLRTLLTKEVRGKSGGKEKVLRAPVALGMMTLARRLPAASFELHLQPLLMTVCQSLKSRDSNARDTARDTLAKMAVDLGPSYLHQIITELRTCLVTGYQLHVRIFTLHTVLKRVADSYVPPNPPSVDICPSKAHDEAVDVHNEAADVRDEASAGAVADRMEVVPAIPSSLVRPPFDACIPHIVELLMEDLFGEIAAAKEAQGANVASSKMKEAKGQKANDSFEIVARTLLFRPTFTVLAPEAVASVSSVHALVEPVLKRLEGCESARQVGKCSEALARIARGLAANPSVTEPEMLLYVHATVAPFLLSQATGEEDDEYDVEEGDSEDSSDSDNDMFAGGRKPRRAARKRDGKQQGVTSEMNPKDHHSRGAAVGEKRRREWESIQVLDGASAPKHTGRDKHDGRAAGRLRPGSGSSSLSGGAGGSEGARESGRGVDLSDPAALGAVTLALGLLHSRLKAEGTARGGKPGKRAIAMGGRREDAVVRSMADSFVPLLTRSIGKNPHTQVVLLSLKSLCYLLYWKLPSMRRYAPIVGRHVLARLVRGGVGGIRGEMGQACFKALTMLFKNHVQVFGGGVGDDDAGVGREVGGDSAGRDGAPGDGAKRKKSGRRKRDNVFGLSAKQLRALLMVLKMAVAETEHQNATFTLIKVVVSRKVMLPEVYDLMTKLAELAVTSHHPNLRASAGQTFLTFLVQYPLGEKRLQFHLNQIVSGVSYEHAEGRLAALSLVSQLLRRLPEPKLDELASAFYLALVVRVVNDPASECRTAAAAATNILLERVSGDVFHQLLDFTGKWFGDTTVGLKGRGEVDSPRAVMSTACDASAPHGGVGGGTQDAGLKRTAAQASGIFIQARPELLWKGRAGWRLPWLLSALASMLPPRAADAIAAAKDAAWEGGSQSQDWEGVYHALLSIGKAFETLPGACNATLLVSTQRAAPDCDAADDDEGEAASSARDGLIGELLDRMVEALLYPHAWIRLAADRVWGTVFAKRNPGTLAVDGGGDSGAASKEQLTGVVRPDEARSGRSVASDDGVREFLRKRRVLFRLCQNFCSQLNRSQVDPKLTEQCVKNLVFIGRAMHLNPELCFAESPSRSDTEEDEGDSDIPGEVDELEGGVPEEDGDEGVEGAKKAESSNDAGRGGSGSTTNAANPLTWVFNRMSHMVVHKGEARRRAVFSWFAAMIAVHEPAVSVAHLRLILLPLRRAVLDAEAGGVEADAGVSSGTRGDGTSGQGGAGKEQTSAELATEVMELLESKVGSGLFLEALTGVNMEIARKRVERKRQRAVEKATDPVAAAERRKDRMEAGKVRKKRKVEEKAKLKGGTKGMRMRAGQRVPTSSRGRGRGSRGTVGGGLRGGRRTR